VNRLIALVRRELGADEVIVLDPGDASPEGALVASLPSGARIAVLWQGEPDLSEAKRRRLEMLVDTFAESFRSTSPSRPPPAQSLHDELQWLAQRAGALDAVVIDAQSPVVWGAAMDDDGTPHLLPRDNVVSLDKARTGELQSMPPPDDPPLTHQAIDAVRALPSLASLHRGGHLHEASREPERGWLARSFAGIYVLVLVFDDLFDELRAERALALSLPSIERLVTLLPPLDPTPSAGVAAAAIRRRRR
jgi:hypothetical protein